MARSMANARIDALYDENEAAHEALNTERGIDEILASVTPEDAQEEFKRLANELHDAD